MGEGWGDHIATILRTKEGDTRETEMAMVGIMSLTLVISCVSFIKSVSYLTLLFLLPSFQG